MTLKHTPVKSNTIIIFAEKKLHFTRSQFNYAYFHWNAIFLSQTRYSYLHSFLCQSLQSSNTITTDTFLHIITYYTCQLSRIMRESHAWGLETSISRIKDNFSRLTHKSGGAVLKALHFISNLLCIGSLLLITITEAFKCLQSV